MTDFSKNYLQNKQITIFQATDSYRASTDAVFLASSIKELKPKDKVLDVGSGTGAISLCLAHRFKDISCEIIGLEIQPRLCELSNLSAKENRFENLKYIQQDIREKEQPLNFNSFSYVITNPPYSENDFPSPNDSKSTAHNMKNFSLEKWIDFCIKMVKPKGFFHIINRAEAIDEILYHMKGRLGNIEIIPIYSKENQIAKRVIIIGKKNSSTPTSIDSGLIIHDKDNTHSQRAHNILTNGGYIKDL